jgi:hypothetical protein
VREDWCFERTSNPNPKLRLSPQVAIDSGEDNIFTLKGPQTARQVTDAILRSESGDSVDEAYTAEDARLPRGCSECPGQEFCGT